MNKQAQLNELGLIDGGTAVLTSAFRAFRQQLLLTWDRLDGPKIGMRQTFETIAQELGQNYGPVRQSAILASIIQNSAQNIREPDQKVEFLKLVKEATALPLNGADNKTDLFQIPLSQDGRTIKTVLDAWEGQAEKAQDQEVMGCNAGALQGPTRWRYGA